MPNNENGYINCFVNTRKSSLPMSSSNSNPQTNKAPSAHPEQHQAYPPHPHHHKGADAYGLVYNANISDSVNLSYTSTPICSYCSASGPGCLGQCLGCQKWFCNDRGATSSSHLIGHLVRAKHNQVLLPEDSLFGSSILECYACSCKNVFVLGFVFVSASSQSNDNDNDRIGANEAEEDDLTVVILCRQPCYGKDASSIDPSWDLSTWAPLISERAFVDWLIPVPTSAGIPVSSIHISRLESRWYEIANSDLASSGPGSASSGAGLGFPTHHLAALKHYPDANTYCNILSPLVELEAEYDRKVKQSLILRGVPIRWSVSASGRKIAYFCLETRDEFKLAMGDAVRLIENDTIPSNAIHGYEGLSIVTWVGLGHVVKLPNALNNEVGVELKPSYSENSRTYGSPPAGLQSCDVDFVWKSGSYDRMQDALAIFKREDTSKRNFVDPTIRSLILHGPSSFKTNPDAEDQLFQTSERYLGHLQAPGLPKLNPSQQRAVATALHQPLSLIQGPPGTGKTVTSATLVYQFATSSYLASLKKSSEQTSKNSFKKDTKRANTGTGNCSRSAGSSGAGKKNASKEKDPTKMSLDNNSDSLGPPLKSMPILVCAPSNIAVDQLATRIHKTGLNVVRVYAKSRESIETTALFLSLHTQVAESNPEIKRLRKLKDENGKISTADEKKYNSLVASAEHLLLSTANVVCTTCVSAADMRFSHLKFKAVLIDEATQATEPEILIPITRGGIQQVVLVGDHRQLGPVVMCRLASAAGLSSSLFERLVSLGNIPARLTIQYRMHPFLAEFPSNTFYDGALQNGLSPKDRVYPPIITHMNNVNLASSDILTVDQPSLGSFQSTKERYLRSSIFPWTNPERPLMFWYTLGQEEISASGTSYLNRAEAAGVEKLVTRFLKTGLSPEQVGVITPYEGQRAYVVQYLQTHGPLNPQLYLEVEVASVDAFQGREKDFIILTCVRSNEHQGIGFLSDSRRLNVALTRAKYGVVIVGNPKVLMHQKVWNQLLTSCKKYDCIVEGPLINLKLSSLQIQPIPTEDDKSFAGSMPNYALDPNAL